MEGLTPLKPISEGHAIKEAVISVFFAGPIFKPQRFQQLIENEFKGKFQQFETINGFQIQLKGTPKPDTNLSPQINPDIGFKFTRFENGEPSLALQGLNDSERYFISVHALKYKRWIDFKDEFKNCFAAMAQHLANMFVVGFGLHYRDEFMWQSELDIPVADIFRKDSELLPNKFFSRSSRNLILTSEEKTDDRSFFDRLEVNIGKSLNPNISISHNIVEALPAAEELSSLLKNNELTDMLDKAHIDNKSVLKSVLTKEVQDLIHLK
jgi:uncharacterized protein (TIGR04255 family)